MVDRGQHTGSERKREALSLRLNGWTYAQIGLHLGITRQRVQQLTRPPRPIMAHVAREADWTCQACGIRLGSGGHIHHQTAQDIEEGDYNDIANLVYLCASCHRKAHNIR